MVSVSCVARPSSTDANAWRWRQRRIGPDAITSTKTLGRSSSTCSATQCTPTLPNVPGTSSRNVDVEPTAKPSDGPATTWLFHGGQSRTRAPGRSCHANTSSIGWSTVTVETNVLIGPTYRRNLFSAYCPTTEWKRGLRPPDLHREHCHPRWVGSRGMWHVTVAGSLEELAAPFSGVLAAPVDDPMAPEWVVVPTAGVEQWLQLRLARDLGASGPGAGDGVAANLRLARPGPMRRHLLAGGLDRAGDDPWTVERLTWTILGLRAGDDGLGLPELPAQASPLAWSHRIADRFDRYHVHRPAMVRTWRDGHDLDGVGGACPRCTGGSRDCGARCAMPSVCRARPSRRSRGSTLRPQSSRIGSPASASAQFRAARR